MTTPDLDDLKSILDRIASGQHTDADIAALVRAVSQGQLPAVTLATGERAVALGGDATGAIIISGDNNTVRVSQGPESVFDQHGQHVGHQINIVVQAQPSPAAAPPPALHQLPAPPADFTGREAQLAELRTHLGAQSAAQGALISGMGGCGKTALALQLAQELAPRYPDAQFLLDLKGTSRPPRPPAEVMAEVLHVYDPAARLPETEAALAPL
ncbi:MAG: ATP-binding protein, partial [Chloroflexi bacterium]|nr:ATP-binding protein [Chloroflexota bacterium]